MGDEDETKPKVYIQWVGASDAVCVEVRSYGGLFSVEEPSDDWEVRVCVCVIHSFVRWLTDITLDRVVRCKALVLLYRVCVPPASCGVISPLLSLEHASGLSAMTKTIPLINECL